LRHAVRLAFVYDDGGFSAGRFVRRSEEPNQRREDTVAEGTRPSEAEINSFVEKLRAFRDTLPEGDRRLLNAMYYAAMGKHEEKDEDVHSYWVAAGPRGVAAGGYGGWAAAPWGAAYGRYYW
jgi:hypothetical protein